ncbi:MAG TPA: DegT/DnrJ/EryC1/StrS family aminotransferase [Bryobacteraceae bacterium]|nr:DegT/DnrJ/EryC1/StrS family aminotransferase [Bryobacteraceae bacterium]
MRAGQESGRTRRAFVQAGLAGLGGTAARAQSRESLAVAGGAKAVTCPAAKTAAILKWPRYGREEQAALAALLENNNWYAEIPAFEKELKQHLNAPYIKAHMNGTSALMSMFFALDLPPGSEILAPSYTAWATTALMHLFGYVPVFVDINPRTMTFDLAYARRALTSRTKAVLPMHSFGNPCDMDEICDFARQQGLIVLEDAAQAQGASLKGKPMGTWGAIGVFSFQASKLLPSVEGGAGIYQTREHYERATTFGAYELPASFPPDSPYRVYQGTGMGPKLRIHPFAAAIARHQLRKMDEHNVLVDTQLRRLNGRLAELPGISHPYTRPDAKRVYWASNMIFIDEKKAGASKDALLKALRAEGVQASPGHYDEQHRYKLYSESKWWHHPVRIPDDLHGTTQVNQQAVRLPVFHDEAAELIEQYARAFEKVWAHRSELARA